MHIDMDAFYASVEQKDNPEFIGKPVVVGADPKEGRGRGVVSAASYEARKFGIHSAMPISKAYCFCPQAVFLPVRGRRYVEISRRIMDIFHEYSPAVEAISLDEAFLDFTGAERLLGTPKRVAMEIKKRIRDQEGLSASIGIGPNKLIAKIASDMEKPDGLVIVPIKDVESFLKELPVRRIWGIGKKTEHKLHAMGILTIGQMAKLSEETLELVFGKSGLSMWKCAHGIDDSQVIPFREAKSISNEITFDRDELDQEILFETLLRLSEKVGFRLRKRKLTGKTVTLKIRFEDFSTRITHFTLPKPICNSEDIYSEVRKLYHNIIAKNRPVRLLGVGITQLCSQSEHQEELFSESNNKRKHASQAVDQLKKKYGEKIIGRGGYMASKTKGVY